MTSTMIPPADVPRISHGEAMVLAETEFGRMTGLLRQLGGGEWQRRTICPLWDVRSMVAHVLGMAEAQASFRQFVHDYRSAAEARGRPDDRRYDRGPGPRAGDVGTSAAHRSPRRCRAEGGPSAATSPRWPVGLCG